MKNFIQYVLLFCLFLGSTFTATASHLAGGDIKYTYISSSGNNHKYEVCLKLYRDASGISMPTSATVYACSALHPTQSTLLSLNANSGGVAPTLFDCVSATNAGITIEVYEYCGEITLPGTAPDWTFAWSDCCRNPLANNINAPSSQSLYLAAKLNNQIGQNSSPEFVSEPVRAFCVGRTFNWKQSAIEADGDSIFYRIDHVKGGNAANCAGTNLTYANGWTYDQPITTNPPNSMTMNPGAGLITFTPSMVEIDVMAVTVDEYRYDSTLFIWRKIGEVNRDMQVAIAQDCTPLAQAGVQLDFQAPSIYQDPISGLPTVDYTCLDSTVVLKFSVKLDCSTISGDGTDFRLTRPDGQPLAIKSISAPCDVNGEATELTISLHKPLSKNGKYFLYSKVGNDGNTLLNKCGFPMNEFDTIQLNVEGCFESVYSLENVTIEDDEHPVVEWSADTSSYPMYLFEEWQVYRKDPGSPDFAKVGTVFDPLKFDFKDEQIGFIKVDQNSYEYRVQMKLNDALESPTNKVRSILLERSNGQVPIVDPQPGEAINLIWNSYNGWPVDSFTVVLQEKRNGAWLQEFVHDHISSPMNPVPGMDTTYAMYVELVPGEYRVCVRTKNPLDTQHIAHSNCLPIIITTPPFPDTVVIPNFITPNADNVNDEFILGNVDQYNDLSTVRIFNRWGDLVWKSDPLYQNSDPWRGTNQSGARLADGVYFYTIELVNAAAEFEYTLSGTVTIMDAQ